GYHRGPRLPLVPGYHPAGRGYHRRAAATALVPGYHRGPRLPLVPGYHPAGRGYHRRAAATALVPGYHRGPRLPLTAPGQSRERRQRR
ncbi:hypothetical protein, partial [Actinoplanes sp. NBRC 103695]|uniref:hypothetical protein n=1 Tax=Actinoplanes sp. NBRC 103695 TaxID=3032202 RepID=UPI002555F50A